MIQGLEFIGLCCTCNNAPTCVYRRLRGRDALFCELFDNYVPSPNGGRGRAVAEATVDTVVPASEEPGGRVYVGLCVNCENRETCRLPRPKEGVWHCEEYC